VLVSGKVIAEELQGKQRYAEFTEIFLGAMFS
jgi:hypothetical protein